MNKFDTDKIFEMVLCSVKKINNSEIFAPIKNQAPAKRKEIVKTIVVFIIAITAVSVIFCLTKTDKYGENRLSTMEYIGVEQAIKCKDYAKAQKLLVEKQHESDIYYSDKKLRLYKRYVTYYAACYAFDNGRYVEAYGFFDEIRGFRDVDSFYDRDEYKLVLHKDYFSDLQ